MPPRQTSAARARTKVNISTRRRQVSLWLEAGFSQQQIVAEFRAKDQLVSAATISGDVAWLREQKRAESIVAYGVYLDRELVALAADELRLRQLWDDHPEDLRIYDRISAAMDRRVAWLRDAAKSGEGSNELDQILQRLDL